MLLLLISTRGGMRKKKGGDNGIVCYRQARVIGAVDFERMETDVDVKGGWRDCYWNSMTCNGIPPVAGVQDHIVVLRAVREPTT